MKSGTLLVEFC